MVKFQTETEEIPSMGGVTSLYNHIFFYALIDADKGSQLIQTLKEAEANCLSEKLLRGVDSVPIWLHINSDGGDLYTAFAVADQIESLAVPVYSIIEGRGASAATILSVGCKKRYIKPHAYMLIHQFSSWFSGTHEDFKDELILQEMLMDTLVDFYSERIKMTKETLQEKLRHNFWMNAQQAVEYGFVDEVLK